MHEGWHSATVKRVRCLTCGPSTSTAPGPDSRVSSPAGADPIGGSSALREAQRHPGSPSWLKGATGEYLTDRALDEDLRKDARILTDRGIPGTRTNIDHLVVAPSGIWVIDSKYWEGRIEYRPDSVTSAHYRLWVGGVDRTDKLDKIYAQVIPVAQIVGKGIPIEAALVLVLGDWSLASMPRLLMNRPFKHGPVWIAPPRVLIKRMNGPGPLSTEDVERLATLLDERLPIR